MNIQTNAWVKESQRIILGLLAISAFGVVALPARADDAVIQESIQESINTGNGNTSIQNSYQESRINRRGRKSQRNQVDAGVVQKNDQFCDQLGDDNVCLQNSEQHSRIYYRRGR